jgi:hypothetical protein
LAINPVVNGIATFFPGFIGKYIYPKETLQEMEEFFRRELDRYFPGAKWSIWCR